MEINIIRLDDDTIITSKDFSDIKDMGEIAHVLCELEIMKQELLKKWDEFKK